MHYQLIEIFNVLIFVGLIAIPACVRHFLHEKFYDNHNRNVISGVSFILSIAAYVAFVMVPVNALMDEHECLIENEFDQDGNFDVEGFRNCIALRS
jgi:Na+/proline symporter